MVTSALQSKVSAMYDALRFIVQQDPKASLGAPTIRIVRHLLTITKESAGSDAKLFDTLIEALMGPQTVTITAADALVMVGYIREVTGT